MSDKPVSITAARAKRSERAADWTVRDALEEALRLIDEPGSNLFHATRCVLVFGTVKPDGSVDVYQLKATPNRFEADGLLAGALT